MNLPRLVPACMLLIGVVPVVCGFGPHHTAKTQCISVIVTSTPRYEELAALRGQERFPQGARLLLHQSGETTPLVPGFAATADANISFDGTHVLFAGKQKSADTWGIWELKLSDRSVRKVLGGATDLVRPLYLPADSLVYARRTAHGFQIESASLEGSGASPLTHLPTSAIPVDVLADGRVLFESTYPLGTSMERGGISELYLMYSDGSGIESYRCDHGVARWGGTQLASGDVVFTHGERLARFSSPFATERPVTAPRSHYAGGIVETTSGDWIVSARATPKAKFAVKRWQPGSGTLIPVLAQTGEDLVEPVAVVSRPVPKHHPSALHEWSYANLLALDARLSRDGKTTGVPARVRVQRLDDSGHAVTLGSAPIEKDGSFFVKVPGDTPIRFTVMDASGKTLRAEHGWFWIRSGEQRICVGCHTGPERAPENRMPEVLLHSTTPVDLAGTTQQARAEGR